MPHLDDKARDFEAAQCSSDVRCRRRPGGRVIHGAFSTVLLALLLAAGSLAAAAPAADLVRAARQQVGVTLVYDSAYRQLAYPNGDVPPERGVCADVIVRAYRGVGVDLQKLVHDDMAAHFDAYPKRWGLKAPDRNIDHRRVPNLATWFARHGKTLPNSRQAGDYLAGDVVVWRLDNGLPHIGLVVAADPVSPRVVHNIGAGAQEEAVLFDFTITGHYRYAAP